ncbi:SRPBCC family protein [bacterium]|nr:MAG: SRPBCC family protein [bacterium]
MSAMNGREEALKRPLDVTDFEHLGALAAGTLLVFAGWRRGGPIGALMKLGGAAFLYRGQQGYKRLYQVAGLELAPTPTGVGEYNVRVDASVEIAQPPRELYRIWRNLENLPVFMDYLEDVREIDETRSEWTVKTPVGAPVKWEAEIINDIPDELIAWQSLEGSGVDNAGSVRFEDIGNGRTRIKVVLRYDPPGDALGQKIAKLFGKDAQVQVEESLARFKRYMELDRRLES